MVKYFYLFLVDFVNLIVYMCRVELLSFFFYFICRIFACFVCLCYHIMLLPKTAELSG